MSEEYKEKAFSLKMTSFRLFGDNGAVMNAQLISYQSFDDETGNRTYSFAVSGILSTKAIQFSDPSKGEIKLLSKLRIDSDLSQKSLNSDSDNKCIIRSIHSTTSEMKCFGTKEGRLGFILTIPEDHLKTETVRFVFYCNRIFIPGGRGKEFSLELWQSKL